MVEVQATWAKFAMEAPCEGLSDAQALLDRARCALCEKRLLDILCSGVTKIEKRKKVQATLKELKQWSVDELLLEARIRKRAAAALQLR